MVYAFASVSRPKEITPVQLVAPCHVLSFGARLHALDLPEPLMPPLGVRRASTHMLAHRCRPLAGRHA